MIMILSIVFEYIKKGSFTGHWTSFTKEGDKITATVH